MGRAVRGGRTGGAGSALTGSADYGGELVGVEAASANQRAVDVGKGKQLAGVVRIHAAAVEEAHPLRLLAGAIAHQGADEGERLLGLLRGGHLSGPIAQIRS